MRPGDKRHRKEDGQEKDRPDKNEYEKPAVKKFTKLKRAVTDTTI